MRSALALLQECTVRVRVHSQLKQKRKHKSPRMGPSGGMAFSSELAGWATWLQTCAQTARNRARRCQTTLFSFTYSINNKFVFWTHQRSQKAFAGKATYIKHGTRDDHDLCSQFIHFISIIYVLSPRFRYFKS